MKWIASIVITGLLGLSGCQPDVKIRHAEDEGLVEFDGEFTQPSDVQVDRGLPGADAGPPMTEDR